MHGLRRLIRRWEVLFRKSRAELELDEEIRYHLEREVQANIGEGMSPKDARRKALVDFGGVDRWKEQVREVRGARSLDAFLQDMRVALRSFAHTPGFALAAILILGVGIGATTTIFSVVDTVIFRPLPYPRPGELVHFENGAHTVPDFLEWRDHTESFSAVAAAWETEVDLTREGVPERLRVAQVTEGFLPMLGASPHMGRLFRTDDFVGEGSVVLLDHGMWQRRWGSDSSVIGRAIHLAGRPVVVVGVVDPDLTPPEISVGNRVDVWVPLDVNRPDLQTRDLLILSVVARLGPGVGPEAAQAEIDALMTGIAEEFPERYFRRDGSVRPFALEPLQGAGVQEVRPVLLILLGAVVFMLLIACANVANLFLARGTARSRELSLRRALGASGRRIIGQLLAESGALALAGGILGVGLAYLGTEIILRYNTEPVPRLQDLAVDPRILGFALITSLGTGVLCGVLPALQAVRKDMNEGLNEGTTRGTTGPGRRRVRNGLVVAEISLTLVLLNGAGLLFRSFIERIRVDPGFDTGELVTMPLNLEGGRFSAQGGSYTEEGRLQFVRELMERLEVVPGVQAVAAGWTLPFERVGRSRCCWGRDVVPAEGGVDEESPWFWIQPVTPGYFHTLDAPLSSGREFTPADGNADPFVAVLNEPTARHLFGRVDVVGEHIRIVDVGTFQIIGVAEGVHHWGLDQEVDLEVYVPWEHFGTYAPFLHVAVRSRAPLGILAPALREAVWTVDPDLPVEEIITMRQRVSVSVAGPRFLSVLFAFFAGVALLLASGGIYASMLYTVGQRRREMGIRLALGATGSRLGRLVLGQGVFLATVGVAIGLAAALGLTRLLESIVWGVTTTDPTTFTSVTAFLALVAVGASLIPAWRASRADPLETLRAE